MTNLQRNALARLPLTEAEVEACYHLKMHPAVHTFAAVRNLCESHERLRAELEGATLLLEDAECAMADALRLLDMVPDGYFGKEESLEVCRLRKLVQGGE